MFYRNGLDRSEPTPEYIAVNENRVATAQDLLPSIWMDGIGAPGWGVPGLRLSGSVFYFIAAKLVSGLSNNEPLAMDIIHLEPDPAAVVISPSVRHSNLTLLFSFDRFWKRDFSLSFQISTPTEYCLREAAPLSLAISAAWPALAPAQKPSSWVPEIFVRSFSIVVEQVGTFWAGPDYLSVGEDSCSTFYRPQAAAGEMPNGIMIPFGPAAQGLDLGRLSNIKLDAVIEMNRKKEGISQLHASFATYNLKRSYKLVWDIGIEVKRIMRTISGKQSIQII